METEHSRAILTGLVDHLVIDTTEDKKNFDRLGNLLTKTSFKTDSYVPLKIFEKSSQQWSTKACKRNSGMP